MGEFAGNVLGTSENPVVSVSRGNFFVANEDHGNEASRKKRLIAWGIGILVAILGIWLLSFLGVDRTQPPKLETMKKLVGTSYADAQLPEKELKYLGIPVELSLIQWNDMVGGFRYTRVTDPEQAAEELLLIGAKLLERYGNVGDFDTCNLTVLDRDALAAALTGDTPYSARWTWDVTERERVELEPFTLQEEWPGRVSGYLIDGAVFVLELSVATDPETGTATLALTYAVEKEK